MSRFHLFEIHEQPWCPPVIRDGVTEYLQFISTLLPSYTVIADDLNRVLKTTNSTQVVDLCSGSGGPWKYLISTMDDTVQQVTLTDLYPNQHMLHDWDNRIQYAPDPVSVMDVPDTYPGFRTIFAAFHHFEPDEACKILLDAVEKGEGIAVYELSERSLFVILNIIIISLLTVPFAYFFVRPFRWQFVALFWLLPWVLAWDGMISSLRTYKPAELQALVDTLGETGYTWEIGIRRAKGTPLPITYLIGYPA